MMEGGDDGHLDMGLQSCQPGHKKGDILEDPNDDEGGPSLQEIDKNPFQLQVILDVVFKMLSFEDVKKFRLVSSTWNEVGFSELSKRPQKPINFHDAEELGFNDKLGELVQLQGTHDLIFPAHPHQLFSRFSFDISMLWINCELISLFLDLLKWFKPSFVRLYGYLYYSPKESSKDDLLHFLCQFIVKIAPTVQELEFYNLYIQFAHERVVDVEFDIVEELTRTKFPNLTKFTNNVYFDIWQKMFYFPIIGQNSPKLCHLSFGSNPGRENSDEELKSMLVSSGMMSKLKFLELLDVKAVLLELFADFGQRGLLKLTKINYKNDNSVRAKENFVRLLQTQGDSLKILKILNPHQNQTMDIPPPIQVPFPRLQNLTFLQIDYFSTFQTFFQPINFSNQFPKLEEFRTFDLETFLDQNLGEGGDSIKFASFLSRQSTTSFDDGINLDKIYVNFPNLEFLQVDINYLIFMTSELEVGENIPFWSRLRKVWIHCELENLYDFAELEIFLKYVKKFEIVVECGNKSAYEDSYKNCLARIVNPEPADFDDFRREKLYRKYLAYISEFFKPIIHLTSISFIGYKISDNFKRDFGSLFPGDCIFVDSKVSD